MNILNFAKQMNANPLKNVYSSDIQNLKIMQIIYNLAPFQPQSILAKTLQGNCIK